MSERIECPKCGVPLEVGDPGRYRCPACRHEFRYPVPAAAPDIGEPESPESAETDYRGPHPSAPEVVYDPNAVWGGAIDEETQPLEPEPGPGPEYTPTTPGTVPSPFEDRDKYGFAGGMLRTLLLTVTDPVRFFRNLNVYVHHGSALLYVLLLGGVGKIAQRGFELLLFVLFKDNAMQQSIDMVNRYMPQLATEMSNGMADGSIQQQMLFKVGIAPLSILTAVFLGALISQSFINGFNKNNAGFSATLRVYCYANGLWIFMIFPVVGPLVGIVWCSILELIGLKEVQKLTYQQAVLAWMIPLFVKFCAICFC